MQRGGWGVAMAERPLPSPSRPAYDQFRREKGVRKTKTRKAQRKTAGMSLSGGAPCANTTRQMDCSGHCAPLHHVPSRDEVTDRLFPCMVLCRVFRTSSLRNGRSPPRESGEHQCPRFLLHDSSFPRRYLVSLPRRVLSSFHHDRRIVSLAR